MTPVVPIGSALRRRAVVAYALIVTAPLIWGSSLSAQGTSRPMGIDEVTRALVQGTPSGVLQLARERCLDFPVDAYTERLRLAGATPASLGALTLVCRGNPTIDATLPMLRPRTELEQLALARYPKPTTPKEPAQPVKPSVAIPVLSALAAGGGGFLGSASLCSSTQTAPAPYGGFVGGRYLAPGESLQSKSAGCAAGSAIGAAAAIGLVTFAVQRSQHARSVRAYEVAAARYPAERANAERTLREWEGQVASTISAFAKEDSTRRASAEFRVASQARRLDSAITVLQREELLTRNALLATQTAPVAPVSAAIAPERARPTFPNDLVPPTTGFKNPNAVAVVIGNRGYLRSEIPVVEYADRDAVLMKRYLVESFGFREENIIFETDASLSTLQRIFGSRDSYKGQVFNFLAADRSSDVFVFYSGHGAPDPATNGTFLVPADADPQTLSLTGYAVRTLYENLAQLPARSLTVVLDACFSGLSDRGTLLRGISPLTLRVENPVLAAPNAVVLSASAGTEVSGWYDQKGHGLFTYVFLDQLTQALNNVGGRELPTARMLRDRLAPEVVRLSRRLRTRDQTPQVFGQASDQPLAFLRR